jgi:hypothetical protein
LIFHTSRVPSPLKPASVASLASCGAADTPWVHAEAEAAVGLDGPGCAVGAVGAAEDELAVARILDLGLVGGVAG